MKTTTLALGLAIGLLAGWLASNGTTAYAKTKDANQWQYQCFQSDDVAEITSQSNDMGEDGWELATAAGAKGGITLWCFKRPRWKNTRK